MNTLTMRTLMIITSVVALTTPPTFANAAPDAVAPTAAGVAVGTGTGFPIGGPAGAARAGVSETVGAGSQEARDRDDVVIEQRRVPASQRSCARDALGNSMCEDIQR